MAPRDDLAGAVVPEGTAPGGEFSVPVVRRRRGEAVAADCNPHDI